jgi:hypothetical protein
MEDMEMTIYVAIGNTFPAKEALKKAGFAWEPIAKEWQGNEAAKAEIERITRPAYGRLYSKMMEKGDVKIIAKEIDA